MEGFVGDLLRAHQDENSGGWVYRSLKANSFSGENISYRNFLLVLDGLGDFVEKKVGYQAWSDGFDPGGPRLQLRGKATRFRASPLFIQYCSDYGVDVAKIGDHFIQDLPQHPLAKNAGSVRDPYGVKVRGRRMRFDRTPKALQLEQQVRELNEFLDRFDLRGGSHRGYVRIFNQGDHPSFDWNKGGRMYSQRAFFFRKIVKYFYQVIVVEDLLCKIPFCDAHVLRAMICSIAERKHIEALCLRQMRIGTITFVPECFLIFFAGYSCLGNFERSVDLKRVAHVYNPSKMKFCAPSDGSSF